MTDTETATETAEGNSAQLSLADWLIQVRAHLTRFEIDGITLSAADVRELGEKLSAAARKAALMQNRLHAAEAENAAWRAGAAA